MEMATSWPRFPVDMVAANAGSSVSEGEGRKRLTLMLHPILEAYITQGWWRSIRRAWEKKFGMKLAIESNSSMEILEFHVYNALGEEVTLD
jgi:hypothetical protein